MSFPRYERYKESGVEWLGEVPEHWQLKKLASVAAFKGGGTPAKDKLEFWNGEIPWVSPKDMKNEFIETSEDAITEAGLAASATTLIQPGAVLMVVRSGILKHTIPVAINTIQVTLNQDMKAIVLDPSIGLNEFFLRWVQGLNEVLLNVWLKQGATVESVEHSYISNTDVPFPSISEQEVICKFLRAEKAKIDALIEEQRRLIELLKEKHQAVISQAVTKGLDPSVSMKDSATSWLGLIPENWEVVPLGYLVKFFSGGTPDKTNQTYWDGSVPWVSPKDMKVAVILDSQDHVTEEAINTGGLRLYADGHVLVVVRGMILAHTFPVAINSVPVTINQDMKAILCGNRILPEFLQAVMIGLNTPIVSLADESAHGTLKLESSVLNNLAVALPKIKEQQQILGWIRTQKLQLDQLCSQAERAVILLEERRSALISAAVTGKIDVRSYSPKEAA